MRVLGAILCGGRASRFGSDKARALLDGRTLLDHVAQALAPQVEAVVVCGRIVDAWPSLPDRPAADLGPLAGLNAALHHALATGVDAVLTVPCDTPLLPPDLRARLGLPPSYVAGLPVIGLWPAEAASSLDAHLSADPRRSMRGWAQRIGASPIALDVPFNVNTPADLARLADEGQASA